MKFKKGDVIKYAKYRIVLGIVGGKYRVKPILDDDKRGKMYLSADYVDSNYKKVTKLELLLLGLDTEDDTVYNGEKEQT